MSHRRDKGPVTPPAREASTRNVAAAIIAILVVYAAALLFAHGRAPRALNNDVAEEALRGMYLVNGPHFEVITFAIGNSAETLYLYLMGAAIRVLGPTMLSIQLVSWIFALACIWLVWKLVERVDKSAPAWVSLLAGATSIWLFHYAMSGLRAIAAPVFLGAFALLLDGVERGSDRKRELLCGAVLGLSIYAYTSARVLPIAFLLYAVYRLARKWSERAILLRRYAGIVAGAFVVSIPNLIFFVQRPKDFLSRGNYIAVMTSTGEQMAHVMWSILLPFYYPDFYRHTSSFTPAFNFDPICSGLTLTGANPVHWIVAAGILLGIWRARQLFDSPVMAYLAAAWVVAMAALGWAGPSLTRMLVVWPVYMVLAALGFGFAIEWRPALRIPVLTLMLLVGVWDGYRYLTFDPRTSPEYLLSFNPAATAIGEAARALAHGQRVLCVTTRDRNVVKYLTSDAGDSVRIVEFHERAFDPSQLPLDEFRPNVMLIENSPAFLGMTSRLRPDLLVAQNDSYFEIRLP